MPCGTSQPLLRHLRSAWVPFLVGSAIIATSAQQGSWAAELSRVAFSKFIAEACPFSASCRADFGIMQGTAKRRYEITHVSCYVGIDNTSARPLWWYLHATRSGTPLGRIHLRPQRLGTTSTEVTYHANEQGLVVVPGGGSIFVDVKRDSSTAGAITELICSIGGYDVRLN